MRSSEQVSVSPRMSVVVFVSRSAVPRTCVGHLFSLSLWCQPKRVSAEPCEAEQQSTNDNRPHKSRERGATGGGAGQRRLAGNASETDAEDSQAAASLLGPDESLRPL